MIKRKTDVLSRVLVGSLCLHNAAAREFAWLVGWLAFVAELALVSADQSWTMRL